MPETGIEPVRPLFTKRRILSPMCLPISPLGLIDGGAVRSRTGLTGFAIRGITALLPRHESPLSRDGTNNTVNKKGKLRASLSEFGAGKESRTLDLNLGKVALYQLSYSRISGSNYSNNFYPFTASPRRLSSWFDCSVFHRALHRLSVWGRNGQDLLVWQWHRV